VNARVLCAHLLFQTQFGSRGTEAARARSCVERFIVVKFYLFRGFDRSRSRIAGGEGEAVGRHHL